MKNVLIIAFTISLITAENPLTIEFVKANNFFAQDVYKQVSQTENGNFLISPFSAEAALDLTLAGCKGQSAEELQNALHLPNDKDKIQSAIKTLLLNFTSSDSYSLYVVNKIYLKQNLTLKEEFKNAASLVYQSDTEPIDFQNVQAANIMNDWVEKQTHNKIKNLINSDDLDDKTRSVIINGLYFKANWSHPFPLDNTEEDDFFKTATDVVQVDTLHLYEKNFSYYECPHLKAQFLELPFKGDGPTMVIVLPNEKDGLSTLESQLDRVFGSQHTLQSTLLNVALPKFQIETFVEFNKILKQLGVEQIFDPDNADLSGIAGEKGDLYVNKVAQKNFIEVGEEGVEAAAATLILISEPRILEQPVVVPKQFIADHPFIFFMKMDDVIIFAGRVTDPSK